MAWFRNEYACPCGEEWDDHWSCRCDDDCPKCGTTCSPNEAQDGDDLTVIVEKHPVFTERSYSVKRSPSVAGHSPRYVTVDEFETKEEADAFAEKLREVG